MSDTDPGPKPDPVIEPGEPNPGGVDAVPDDPEDDVPLTRDLHPDENPATGEVPLEMKESEDTSTEATEDTDPGGEDSEDGSESQEAPA